MDKQIMLQQLKQHNHLTDVESSISVKIRWLAEMLPKVDLDPASAFYDYNIHKHLEIIGCVASICSDVKELVSYPAAVEGGRLFLVGNMIRRNLVKPISDLLVTLAPYHRHISQVRYLQSSVKEGGYERCKPFTYNDEKDFIVELEPLLKMHKDSSVKIIAILSEKLEVYIGYLKSYKRCVQDDRPQFASAVKERWCYLSARLDKEMSKSGLENLLYQSIENEPPVLELETQTPTPDDWARLLKIELNLCKNDPMLSILANHNVKGKLFDIDDHFMLDSLYKIFGTKEYDENKFLVQMYHLNSIKKQIFGEQASDTQESQNNKEDADSVDGQESKNAVPESVNKVFTAGHTSDYVKNRLKDAIKMYCVNDVDYYLLELTLFDNDYIKKPNAHKDFITALMDWGVLTIDEDSKKDPKESIIRGMTSKKSTKRNGCYKDWDKKDPDKEVCEKIAEMMK